MMLDIQLTQYEADLIRKPVNGIGGVQSLLRQLQMQLQNNNTLSISEEQIERIKMYRSKYGRTGGYQTRLESVVKHITAKQELQTLDGF